MSIRIVWSCAAVLAAACVPAACKAYDPLYCDQNKPCTDPDRPFCDLHGEYKASEGVARTCIPDPGLAPDAGPADAGRSTPDASFCSPGEFLQCSDGQTAIYCNGKGTEYVTIDCGSDCDPDNSGCYCEPETSACADDQTIHCAKDGKLEEIEPCAMGCNDTGERCVDVDPSNGLAGYLDMTDDAPVVALSNGASIDTDAATIRDADGMLVNVPTFQISAPAGGVGVRVFAVKSLSIGDATVTGERAIAFVSDGDILVRGHLRVLAGSIVEGSCVGARPACVGAPPTGGLDGACSGAGGGGFGTPGGEGGTASVGTFTSPGALAGSSSGNSTLVPLRGGCAGGGGQGSPDIGGPGGGAIQMVSRTFILIEGAGAQAVISSNGRGIAGVTSAPGGGSGGAILLEAPRVVVSGGMAVVANGGGGTAGCSIAGEDGLVSIYAAEGGDGCMELSNLRYGEGGAGGGRVSAPSDGESDSHPNEGALVIAGGGGGAVGRIRINVPVSSDFGGFGIVSPNPSLGTLRTR